MKIKNHVKLSAYQNKIKHFASLSIIILFLQHLIVYWSHYFDNVGFSKDFVRPYFVIPAFWTTALDVGIFTQWNPFSGMGIPLFIKAQSGFLYPFLWIFPIFSIQYTLQSSVIFQVLHIFMGSIGMFFFLKFMFNSPRYALLGAIAFQFFGGFFANADHSDTVRSFAIAPWMFFVFTLNLDRPTISRRILFIPIVIYLLATGGQPTMLVSIFFIMSLFIVLQTINGFVKNIGKRKSLVIGGVLTGLMMLGFVIAVVHLGPVIEHADQMTRYTIPIERKFQLTVEQFPGFFMSNSEIPYKSNMNSTFLTLPILIFASFFPLSLIKKYWIFFVVLIVAVLMSIGTNSFLFEGMTSLSSYFDLSQRPVSDYRIFIAIPIIISAIVGLKAIIERKYSLKTFSVRVVFILLWFSFGLFLLHSNIEEVSITRFENLIFQTTLAILILIFTILVLGIFVFKTEGKQLEFIEKPIRISLITLILLTLLISIDGFGVISDIDRWREKPLDKFYYDRSIPLEKDGKLITYGIFENLPTERPEREFRKTIDKGGAFEGYLLGRYTTGDIAGGTNMLISRDNVNNNQDYSKFMLMKWTPMLIEPRIDWVNRTEITLPKNFLSNLDSIEEENSVVQTHYGINEITYRVSLKEPKLMIENEMYFPGWGATLIYPNKEVQIESLSVNKIFRTWFLPEGEYEMKAKFQFPNLITYQSISFIAFAVWVTIVILFWKKFKTNSNLSTHYEH